MPIKDFIIFLVAIAVIIKSADLFTSGASGIAQALKIPRMIIGLTLISLATSAPEFAVSVISSSAGRGGLAVGNALGSCIANIGLALGLAAMVRAVHFQPQLIKLELKFLIGITILLFLLMLDFRNWPNILEGGTLGFGDGLLLSFLLVSSFFYIVRRELRIRKKAVNNSDPPPHKLGFATNPPPHPPLIKGERGGFSATLKFLDMNIKKDLLKFFIGAVGVIASAKYGIIPSGLNIARFLEVPEIVIGLSMVAVGTSLPELFTVLVAAFKKMGGLAAGTIIGSNIVNILWVLGSASLVSPLAIDSQTLQVTMPVVSSFTLIMLLFARSGWRLVRWEGALLFLIYLAYLAYLFKFTY